MVNHVCMNVVKCTEKRTLQVLKSTHSNHRTKTISPWFASSWCNFLKTKTLTSRRWQSFVDTYYQLWDCEWVDVLWTKFAHDTHVIAMIYLWLMGLGTVPTGRLSKYFGSSWRTIFIDQFVVLGNWSWGNVFLVVKSWSRGLQNQTYRLDSISAYKRYVYLYKTCNAHTAVCT